MVFKNLCVLVLWMKVVSALKGFREKIQAPFPGGSPVIIGQVELFILFFYGVGSCRYTATSIVHTHN